MQRLPYWSFYRLIGIGVLSLAGNASAQAAPSSCVECHKEAHALSEQSVHATAGVTCLDCHGGNPNLPDKTAHETENFKPLKDKRDIAESCARCHSDVRRMNPYGLATDQLERYKTSKHGEQLFEHQDQNVATCTDCHGAHDILKNSSPQSRTHPTNIPTTCGKCHSDEKLMTQYHHPADVVEKYKSSYHAHLLFEKGDLSAPTSVTCHGNHGAVAPGVEVVGQACGKCHTVQHELFEKSPHAEAAGVGLFDQCISCHGNHAISKASLNLFSTTCSTCHEGEEKPLKVRDTLVQQIGQTTQEWEEITRLVQEATVQGLATDEEELLLQEAKTYVTQLQVLQHTLSPKELEPILKQFDTLVKKVKEDLQRLHRVEQWKHRSLFFVWIFMLVMAVLFWLKRRQVSRKK